MTEAKAPPVITLSCRIQHIFNKDAISCCWVIYQHVSDSSHRPAVLADGTHG